MELARATTYDVTNKNGDHQESELQSNLYIDRNSNSNPPNAQSFPTNNKLLPQPCPTNPSPIHIRFMRREYLVTSGMELQPIYFLH